MFDFLHAAGPLVWGIIGFSMVMWWLIARAYQNQTRCRISFESSLNSQREQHERVSMKAYQHICRAWLNQAEQQLNQGIEWITVLVKLLPLLGLLGTVDGMIDSFQQLDQLDIQRQLSGGISQALLTTLSGLVTSLSGLYFVHNLNQRKRRYYATFRSQLEVNHAFSS
ncbi:MotA/TolQ/ExbB proton channel family protein [Vibrio kasasachensis]|uniref:MotA/TolQ/ExbB proton channel family protein n=1 Tax=Vibrio kasasachensis TaxID=2910248 RepID=UPI003D0ABDFE